MAQDHLVLLHILDLSVLGNALFVVVVIFLDGLNERESTCGKKGEMSLRCYSFYQSIFLKKGWYLTSSKPPEPSLCSGLRRIKRLMKSMLSLLHPYGGISSSCTCFASIFSLISFLLAPMYGLYIIYNFYSSCHELIGDDSKRKEVNRVRMIHLANDLRRHIARSSACILCVVWLDLPRNPQICDSQVATVIKHQIFWLEITMDNLAGVHVFKAEHDTGQKEAGFFFFELSPIAEMVAQVSSVAVIHH